MKRDDEGAKGTLVGPRNFTLDTQARVRALVAGPPAFVLRRRRIEDLEASLVRKISLYETKTGELLDSALPPRAIAVELASLHRLIRVHNEWYPIEASLPVDVATGAFVDLGKHWSPLSLPTLDELAARARGATSAPAPRRSAGERAPGTKSRR